MRTGSLTANDPDCRRPSRRKAFHCASGRKADGVFWNWNWLFWAEEPFYARAIRRTARASLS